MLITCWNEASRALPVLALIIWTAGLMTRVQAQKETQGPPEHTSEYVKSQNCMWGGVPPDPLHTIHIAGSAFCISPGPPNPLCGPGITYNL